MSFPRGRSFLLCAGCVCATSKRGLFKYICFVLFFPGYVVCAGEWNICPCNCGGFKPCNPAPPTALSHESGRSTGREKSSGGSLCYGAFFPPSLFFFFLIGLNFFWKFASEIALFLSVIFSFPGCDSRSVFPPSAGIQRKRQRECVCVCEERGGNGLAAWRYVGGM